MGALWDERHEGTNGIGTCLAEAGPVTVHREEHFRGYNVSLSCSAAPILDPHGGIMAVLDASTANSSDSRLIQRHTMALVNMSAHLISRWNFLSEYGESWILRFHSRPEFVGLLHEALMAIDDNGNILAVNESALVQLGCSNRHSLVGEPIGRFFQFNFAGAGAAGQIRTERHLAGARCGAWAALFRDRARAAAHVGARRRTFRCRARRSPQRRAVERDREHVGEDLQMRKNLACGGSCSRSRCRFSFMAPPAPARRRSRSPCIAAGCGRTSRS